MVSISLSFPFLSFRFISFLVFLLALLVLLVLPILLLPPRLHSPILLTSFNSPTPHSLPRHFHSLPKLISHITKSTTLPRSSYPESPQLATPSVHVCFHPLSPTLVAASPSHAPLASLFCPRFSLLALPSLSLDLRRRFASSAVRVRPRFPLLRLSRICMHSPLP